MENLTNEVKFPQSASELYIQLYCKRRLDSHNKDENIVVEATKSWLSLSKSEKHQFHIKYNDCKTRMLADYLKGIKPYLKKKKPLIRPRVEINEDNTDITKNESIIEVLANNENDNDSSCKDGHSVGFKSENENVSTIDEPEQDRLEPTPPAFITGEELFNMMHKPPEDSCWANLSQTKKKRYQTAILLIKKNYLKEYQLYLESLPTGKLIHHYKSVTAGL